MALGSLEMDLSPVNLGSHRELGGGLDGEREARLSFKIPNGFYYSRAHSTNRHGYRTERERIEGESKK